MLFEFLRVRGCLFIGLPVGWMYRGACHKNKGSKGCRRFLGMDVVEPMGGGIVLEWAFDG